MVLCSIVIHGLSIPSFSLGRRVHSVSRSVSRTWSRHALAPDWTNQARLVERGADIVINRDNQTEEGKSMPDEKLAPSSRASAITSATSMEKPPIDEGSSETRTDTDARKDYPPDGTEKLMEWHEGSYKVIERREEPGDDVSATPPVCLSCIFIYVCYICRSMSKYVAQRTIAGARVAGLCKALRVESNAALGVPQAIV